MLDVVYTVDKRFLKYFTVSCYSLLYNNINIINSINIVHSSHICKYIKYISSCIYDTFNILPISILIDSNKVASFKVSHHVSHATYYRLLLADILPDTYKYVLYLDSDIVVNGSLNELSSYIRSFHNTYLFAVDHRSPKDIKRIKDMGVNINRYFNTGVLLINIEKWRNDNITNKLLYNANKYNDRILWWDQDILNITFSELIGELDFKYNAWGLSEKLDIPPIIIHYAGSSKPWYFNNTHPYKYLYWKYLRQTPYKHSLPKVIYPTYIMLRSIIGKVKKFIFNNINHINM